jgi:hypothetical protein
MRPISPIIQKNKRTKDNDKEQRHNDDNEAHEPHKAH